ncbi:Xylanase inhibitor, N-terminal, partial [Dillenia turbinata]
CTTSLTGLPTSQGPADGIIGLGHSKVSILSQLASREEAPRIFSHCLTGEGFGGGVLLFGEILVPDLIYTPLVPSRCMMMSSQMEDGPGGFVFDPIAN